MAQSEWDDEAALSEGTYILRSNIAHWTDADLWKTYLQLTRRRRHFGFTNPILVHPADMASQRRPQQGAHPDLLPLWCAKNASPSVHPNGSKRKAVCCGTIVGMLFVLSLLADLLREVLTFLVLLVRPKSLLAAENLFLRRMLALYKERGARLRRIDTGTRVVMVLLSRLFALIG